MSFLTPRRPQQLTTSDDEAGSPPSDEDIHSAIEGKNLVTPSDQDTIQLNQLSN